MYIACLLVYILSCVGTALCPTNAYWLLILMRILQVQPMWQSIPPLVADRRQATGGSCLIAIGSGVVGDIALPQERGKYMGIFNLTSTFGPASGWCSSGRRADGWLTTQSGPFLVECLQEHWVGVVSFGFWPSAAPLCSYRWSCA